MRQCTERAGLGYGHKGGNRMNTPSWEQLEALTQDPLEFFQGFSAFCHAKAEQLKAEAEIADTPGSSNHWAETAELIDLALTFWNEQIYPIDVRHRVMTMRLGGITRMVESYLRP
jgi:hypothetical protein